MAAFGCANGDCLSGSIIVLRRQVVIFGHISPQGCKLFQLSCMKSSLQPVTARFGFPSQLFGPFDFMGDVSMTLCKIRIGHDDILFGSGVICPVCAPLCVQFQSGHLRWWFRPHRLHSGNSKAGQAVFHTSHRVLWTIAAVPRLSSVAFSTSAAFRLCVGPS